MLQYTSTRGEGTKVSGAKAILTGLAPDGGLFVPTEIPTLNFEKMQGKTYEEIALEILTAFLPEYSPAFLQQALGQSYGSNFNGKAGQLVALGDGSYSLELWHGPTAAFKDYALQLMPRLLVEARKSLLEKDRTLILVATSGDTGSAALAGYGGLEGVDIVVFYPQNGTSVLQRLQMTTRTASNVAVYGVRGNFDDAQRGVKAAFVDKALADALAKKGVKLSSANSINWGRLVPQVVYYATSYLALCAQGAVAYGQPVDFCVPTGNFGDIMAGWYAKQMGLPVGRLVCASNQNNVLSQFLETGCYNARRDFCKTSSPSMDILVSSNLERLLWHVCGSAATVRGWMEQLAKEGGYQVDGDTLAAIRQDFAAGWASEDAVFEEMNQTWRQQRYLCDPHTAVAFAVARRHRQAGRPMVVVSTASPYKFGPQVLRALGQPVPPDEFDALHALEAFSGTKAPAALAGLQNKQQRFNAVINPQEIPQIPLSMLSN